MVKGVVDGEAFFLRMCQHSIGETKGMALGGVCTFADLARSHWIGTKQKQFIMMIPLEYWRKLWISTALVKCL